jgi:membrane-associated phospholipid phosphatase
MIKLSKILSYILHPAVIMLITVGVYSSMIRSTVSDTIIDITILLMGLLPGLIYIVIKTKRGEFSHYHLIVKEHRRVTLIILLAGLMTSFVLYKRINAPSTITDGLTIALIGGVLIALITWFWKISFHAAVAMGCAALFVTISIPTTFIFIITALISGLVRLPIKHHTPTQVIFGWIYGFGITTCLLWIFDYF